MNPITNAKNLQKLNQRELELGILGKNKKSWHDEYKDSAWIFIGGLPYDLTEGDIVCVFSQYGEVVNINLVRDKSTGKSKGYAFLCYEDQRSTILAVDNLNTIKLLGRIIRVDHVADYKKPKEKGDEDEVTLKLRTEGCAPRVPDMAPLPAAQAQSLEELPLTIRPPAGTLKPKKSKKEKKKKKKKKKKMKVTVKVERRSESDSSDSSSSDQSSGEEDNDDDSKRKHKSPAAALLRPDDLKREKEDRGYDKAFHGHRKASSPSGRERDSKEDIKPVMSHSDSRHRNHDRYKDEHSARQREEVRYKDEHSARQREEVRVKREPESPDSNRHRDEKRDGRRGERSEHRHRDRDEDSRDRRDYTQKDDRRDRGRDRDDYDRRRR